MNTPIVINTFRFVRKIYREFLPINCSQYHLDKGMELKNNSVSIGLQCGMTDEELEIMSLAAILHNVSCVQYEENNLRMSLFIARTFLTEERLSEEKIIQVLACIYSLVPDYSPRNKMEIILHEALRITEESIFWTENDNPPNFPKGSKDEDMPTACCW